MSTHPSAESQQYLIYFYDLPKDVMTSVKLAEIIKEKTGISFSLPPTFKKSPEKFFDSAIVKIDTNSVEN